LTKPRIIELLLITTVPTMVVAEGGWPSLSLILITLVGGSLAAGGANAINMYIDRDIDALMERTKTRPLVTGLIKPRSALVFAVTLEILAFAILWAGANLLSGLLAISATLFYVFIYSLWLKRTSKQNIVIGGAAGAVPVLVGWAAVTNSLGWTPWLLFLLIFLWTPPHFWALAIKHSDDYKAAGVPMLPVVETHDKVIASMIRYTIALTLCSLAVVPVGNMGWVYGISAGVLGVAFLWGTIALGRNTSPSASMRLFSFSISYISLLFVALTVDVLVR
jgi:protoheme IX farnesyltransferase